MTALLAMAASNATPSARKNTKTDAASVKQLDGTDNLDGDDDGNSTASDEPTFEGSQ